MSFLSKFAVCENRSDFLVQLLNTAGSVVLIVVTGEELDQLVSPSQLHTQVSPAKLGQMFQFFLHHIQDFRLAKWDEVDNVTYSSNKFFPLEMAFLSEKEACHDEVKVGVGIGRF